MGNSEALTSSTLVTRRRFVQIAVATGAVTVASCGRGEDRQGVVQQGTLAPTIEPRRRPAQVLLNPQDSLKAHAASAGLLVGCAAVPELLEFGGSMPAESQDPYTRTIIEQCNILVAENAMKWSSMRPTATTYDFAPADKLFAFAAQYGQKMRGHNLCWHEQLPAWFAATATRTNAQSLLIQHIQTVAGRYAGRVHSWDVVNEAVHPPDGRADGLRKTPWLDLIGPEYIELAFTTAAKADPTAKLTYNDYDFELDTPEQAAKRWEILLLVRRLRARNVPIHAIGLQSHLQAAGAQPGAGLVSFIREVAKMGLEVYVTELDVNTRALPGGPELQDAAVASVYQNYLDLVLAEPNVRAVLTWGITDAHTWLNTSKQPWALRPDGARQRPLPFDDQYMPTPAFFAMRNALDGAHGSTGQSIGQPSSQPAGILSKPEGKAIPSLPSSMGKPGRLPPLPTPP